MSYRRYAGLYWCYLDAVEPDVSNYQAVFWISNACNRARLPFEQIVLEDVLRRAVDELSDQARSKGLVLQLEIERNLPSVLGDAQQLGQALVNLVENAVKFTPSGGKVEVRVEVDKTQVVIHVSDTGIGIPVEEQQRVFEPVLSRASKRVLFT